jgi:hypothetical protein
MKRLLAVFIAFSLLLPLPVLAVDQTDLMKKIDDLSKELEKLKQQMQDMQKQEAVKEERITKAETTAEKAASMWPSWLELGGGYRGRHDTLRGGAHKYLQYDPFARFQPAGPQGPTFFVTRVPDFQAKNDSLLTNRFELTVKAQATEDVSFKGRLLMYKVFGHDTSVPVEGNFFFDRAFGPFDGTLGHIPDSNTLLVDYAYATWSNIADLPVWASVGRRPTTDGLPQTLRLNTEKQGTAGVPCFLINYAFDGGTIGVKPDIPGLPGAYAKL